MSDINILIVGGGTGGHITPGIALYEEFKERGIRVFMLAGRKDRKYSSFNDVEDRELLFYNAMTLSKNIFKLILFFVNFIFLLSKAIIILKRLRIETVIGMGGFVSAPALLAAVFLKIPIFLCEQNTVPGKVTSLFSKYAVKIFTTFGVSRDFIKEENVSRIMHVGNPIRKSILANVAEDKAKAFFNLSHCKRIILVIGGSQGALQVNELFLDILKIYSDDLKDVGIIWSTGTYSYDRVADALQEMNWAGSIFLSPFVDKVGHAYKACDIAISRSGAGVIMELAAAGLPSVLIPYPHAAADHQEKNAEVFDRAGASIKIAKDDIVPDKVGQKLIGLLNNSTQLARMSEKAKDISKINASRDIVEMVISENSKMKKNSISQGL